MKPNDVKSAFSALYREYYSTIYRYCLARLHCNEDNAADCTQEAFIVLYKKISNGETIENPRSFLYVTATNFIKKTYRELQQQQELLTPLDDTAFLIADENAEQSLIGDIQYEELRQHLDSLLSESDKELFDLRFIQALPVKDIAERLQITPANCSLKITRLRRKIAHEIIKYQ